MSNGTVTDTPTGFVINCPWKTIDKAIMVDLKATLASDRLARNVLSSRVAARSQSNLVAEQTFRLAKVGTGQLPLSYTFMGVPGNIFTIFASNYPVQLELTNEQGTLLLGNSMLMFVISAPLVSLKITNQQNLGDAECNIVHV